MHDRIVQTKKKEIYKIQQILQYAFSYNWD